MKNWHFLINTLLYSKNGTIYGHTDSGRQIETRMQSIELERP